MGSEWGIPVDLIAIANWSLGCYLLKNIQNKIADRKIELFHNFVSVHCSLVVICGKEVDFVVLWRIMVADGFCYAGVEK